VGEAQRCSVELCVGPKGRIRDNKIKKHHPREGKGKGVQHKEGRQQWEQNSHTGASKMALVREREWGGVGDRDHTRREAWVREGRDETVARASI